MIVFPRLARLTSAVCTIRLFNMGGYDTASSCLLPRKHAVNKRSAWVKNQRWIYGLRKVSLLPLGWLRGFNQVLSYSSCSSCYSFHKSRQKSFSRVVTMSYNIGHKNAFWGSRTRGRSWELHFGGNQSFVLLWFIFKWLFTLTRCSTTTRRDAKRGYVRSTQSLESFHSSRFIYCWMWLLLAWMAMKPRVD